MRASSARTLKIYGALTIACLAVGALLFFLNEKGPQMVQTRIRDTMLTQAEQVLGRKLTERDTALIEKRFGVKINVSGGGQEGSQGGDFSTVNAGAGQAGDGSEPAGLGKEKKLSERQLLDMVDQYGSGKLDQTDIEKAKRAIREQR